ncbi:AsmA family protein [Pseudodesulfovibrio sp.]|uniref:AsmA family protein n=1 Tax=unclassified Pseudodesulfovibrio TaxID=2661612 RepID=UPI003B0055E9
MRARSLHRLARLIFELGAVAIVLCAVMLFIAARYVDTEGFRSQFVSIVEDLTGQPVELQGELNIALYPIPSLEIQNLSLLERPNVGDNPLVAFDQLFVSAKLLPMAYGRLELRSVVVKGMRLNLARLKNGKYNWSPFPKYSSLPGDSQKHYFDSVSLEGLEVDQASVVYSDRMTGQSFSMDGIDINTGNIVPGNPVPFSAKSVFNWKNGGFESKLVLKGLVVPADDNISLEDASIYATCEGPFLPKGVAPAEFTGNLSINWINRSFSLDKFKMRFMHLRGDGALKSGDLGEGFSGEGYLTLAQFNPSDLVRKYFKDAPVDKVDGLKKGVFSSQFSFDENGVQLKDLTATLDDLTVRGTLSLVDYAHPVYSFDLRADSFDLDRYLPLFKTDTPFVWGDFSLEFFRALQAKGRVQANKLKLLDAAFSNVALTTQSENGTIQVELAAYQAKAGNFKGKAVFSIGNEAKAPTLGLDVNLTAESDRGGFGFPAMGHVRLDGAGKARLSVRTAVMRCPDQERSIGILRNSSMDAILNLGKGQAVVALGKDQEIRQRFSSGELNLKTEPIKGSKTGNFGFRTYGSLKCFGGSPVDSLSCSVVGPVQINVDSGEMNGTEVNVKVKADSRIYTKSIDSVVASGRLSFDSVAKTLGVADASVQLLGSLANGSVKADWSGQSFKAAGKVVVPPVDVHHIIYLLTHKKLELTDEAALKAMSVSADFVASNTGFTLSNLHGQLDSMPVRGLVVGQGWKNSFLTASLTGGDLDIDRYLPRSHDPSVQELRAGKTDSSGPVDLPLEFLRALRLDCKASLEEFKLGGIRTRNLSGVIKAEKGDIRVSSLKGKVYGGALTGELTGKVGPKSLATALKLHVENMQAGPMMQDLVQREYVVGVTDSDVDLTSNGATDDDILANLEGSCRVAIRNGSFKFSGFEAKPASDKLSSDAKLNNTKPNNPRQRRTAFTKASASFAVHKGVFTFDPFLLESPLLNSKGSGWFSLPANKIDLSIRNDFVAVPSVTMVITGKLTDPEVKIPKGKILDNTVRNILSLPQKSFKFLRDLFM